MPECRKFRDKQMAQILIAKSGISNHTAAGICYAPCLSKFGALHGLWLVGHTPGVSKRGRDTKWDANSDMEEIHEFCFKEFAPSVYSGTFHYLLPIFQTGFL